MKIKIEAQGRFLARIAEEYKSRSANAKPSKPSSYYSPVSVSLPSLSEESDSEIERHERAEPTKEFSAPKRIRIDDNDDVMQHKYKLTSSSPNSQSYSQNLILLKGLNSPCWANNEVGFPWSFASQSPLLPALYDTFN